VYEIAILYNGFLLLNAID